MSTCRACGAGIRWARTTAGKAIPLDAEPTDAGNVILEYGAVDDAAGSAAGGTGSPTAHVIGSKGLPLELSHLADEPRWMPHHATCPKWGKR